MTKKIIIILALLAFVASGIGFAVSADTKRSGQLAVLLPESEGVIVFNSERFLNQALPQVLSSNQPMLAKINGKIDELKGKTGMDLRQFTEVAVGIKSRKAAAGKFELEPVILARGTMDSKALVAVAKLASNGKYKTEKVGSRTVYIFTPKEVVDKNKPKDKDNNDSIADKVVDKMFKQLSKEVALTAYDSSTIAIGSVSRVKETIGNTPRISNEVLNLLNRKETAVINVGMVLPSGLSKYVGLDNDELGTNLDAIRQLQGSLDVAGNTTSLSVMAKTSQNAQAESLEEMLMGLQMVGKGLLGGMKGSDKQVYAKMVENMKISRETNQIMLDLNIPQSDLDVIIGKK